MTGHPTRRSQRVPVGEDTAGGSPLPSTSRSKGNLAVFKTSTTAASRRLSLHGLAAELVPPLDSTATIEALNATASTALTSTVGEQRQQRQLWTRQERARSALVEEAREHWTQLVNHEVWARAATVAFRACVEQQTTRQARARAAEAMWDAHLVAEAMRRTAAAEAAARARIDRLQDEERRTLTVLCNAAGRVLWANHRLNEAITAERRRRTFLYAEEVRAAFALGVAGYEPIYLVAASGDGESRVAREKIDYMCDAYCPFATAEHCPFLPSAARLHLRRVGASAVTASGPASSSAVTAAAGRSASGVPRLPSATAAMREAQRHSANATLQLSMRAALRKPHLRYSSAATLSGGSGATERPKCPLSRLSSLTQP